MDRADPMVAVGYGLNQQQLRVWVQAAQARSDLTADEAGFVAGLAPIADAAAPGEIPVDDWNRLHILSGMD